MMRLLALLMLLSVLGSACSEGEPDGSQADAIQAAKAEDRLAPTDTKPSAPLPDIVRVRFDTEAGPITVALDAKRAPITTTNFVRYVDAHRFDGTYFYRAARTKGDDKEGFIQGGIRRNFKLMYAPIAHEPTSKTGLRHVAGTISMAYREPGFAMGDFFIITRAMPAMDAGPGEPGYAASGKVVDGMANVRKILASPTGKGGRGAMKGQMIEKPVRIEKVVRVE